MCTHKAECSNRSDEAWGLPVIRRQVFAQSLALDGKGIGMNGNIVMTKFARLDVILMAHGCFLRALHVHQS
jgi:hypothetical protein